jgi:hypothetical protein
MTAAGPSVPVSPAAGCGAADGDGGGSAADATRVRRLLLWYPRGWRDRYGDEFAELLIAEQAEQGASWRRTVNIAATGLRARLAGAGLAGHPLDPAAAARAGLATFASCVAVSGLVGAVMWAQLAIGLQWSVPDNRQITRGMDLMSGALLGLAALTVLAAVPVAWAAVAAVGRGAGRQLRRPAALAGAGTLVLIIGGRHFANGWPGTGGHLLVHQGLVPGGVAAFGWAATMWMTSYWGHPGMLAAFPAAQLAWMVVSPVATGCLVTGAVQLLHRVELSPRALRYHTWVACIAWAGLATFLGGALCWLLTSGGTAPLFRTGIIDRAGLALLAVTAVIGAAAARRARLARMAGAAGP